MVNIFSGATTNAAVELHAFKLRFLDPDPAITYLCTLIEIQFNERVMCERDTRYA